MSGRNSFNNQPLAFTPNPINPPTQGTLGRVDTINWKTHRCSIRTINGATINNCRIFGLNVSKDGSGHGRYPGIKIDQLVYVGFVNGLQSSPVILQTFPFYSQEKDLKNLETFLTANPEVLPDSEFVDFHESGYSVLYSANKIIFRDKTKTPVLTVNMVDKTVSVGSGTVKVLNGDLTKQYLEDLNTALTALYNAISSSGTSPMDGGATYKSGLVSAITSSPLPVIPPTIDQTNLKIGV